jgi:Domain of unknown function (DUF4412)
MKKNLIFLGCIIASALCAQTFEGTVKWSIKTEITDPALKAQMDGAQTKLNDPATQAQMQELQKQMNDPAMKALMESNPQMKAQMEQLMGGKMNMDLNSMIPSGFTQKMKGGNTLTIMEGGMTGNMEILFLKDKNQSYRLDRQRKSYTLLNGDGNFGSSKPAVKITKISETLKILNYTCTKYTADVTENGRTQTHFYWTTKEIKDFDVKSLQQQRMGKDNNSFYFEGIEGVPLKMEVSFPEGKMVMEVISLKKEAMAQTDFIIPVDFKEMKVMMK